MFLGYALLVPAWARNWDGHPGNEPKYLRMALAIGHRLSLDVEGIDALYAEMQAAGVVHPNGLLQQQPWGMKEFAVLDGDGNLIKFGERVALEGA